MPTLFVLRGSDKGQTFPIPEEPALLGRDSDQIPLTDNSVSRRHAEIRPQNGRWEIRDLESSNGTYLNGVRIRSPVLLKHGDQIKLGAQLLVFSGEESQRKAIGSAEQFRDMIELDRGGGAGPQMDSSILSAVGTSDDSLILAAPETAEAVHAWKVMYQLAEMLGAGLTIPTLLERVTDIFLDNLTVDRVFVLLRDEVSGDVRPVVVRHRAVRKDGQQKITTSQTIINHVFQNKEGVLCANAMTDQRFSHDARESSIHRLGLRSVICVPITAHNEVQGVIHLDCSMSRHTYTNEQLRLATAIGRITGLAMENVRLLESRMAHERLAAVGETVAQLSHHIRNILQGLRSGEEVIELGQRRKSLETIGSGWQIMKRNIDRIYELTTNMLTFSKERQPNIVLGQINQVVRDAVGLVQRRADDKGVMLLADLAEDVPATPLDIEGVSQATVNILNNAIDAVAAREGRVNVQTHYEPQPDEVVLSISDNGPGIPAEDVGRIFEVFHSTKGQGGTGLGLAAAHKIVRELGGHIDVDSGAGEGTTFHIRLPAKSVRLADAEKSHGPAVTP